MRTTKIFALIIALIMVFALTACSDSGNNNSGGSTNTPSSETQGNSGNVGDSSATSPNPKQGNGGDDPPPPDTLPPPADNPYTAYDNATEQERALGDTISLEFCYHLSGDMLITFKPISPSSSRYIELDSIAVLRGTDKNNLEVIAVLTAEQRWNQPERLYIDSGAVGKGYYYGIAGVAGGVTGVPAMITEGNPHSSRRWYKGDGGYLRVAPDSLGNSQYQSIVFYDLDGYLRFTADGGEAARDERFDKAWQYESWLETMYEPGDYLNMGRINFDISDTTFELYGVWTNSGPNPPPYPPCEPALYTFTLY
ncbi:MAG: hypothetical protein FWH17_04665 [Oscillospiraceae bacterium]|nr:hypothetical protein [Oscillospiraceae bacterium]